MNGWNWINGKGRGNGDPYYLPGEAPEPCFICGDPDDHLGRPHGVATGDGRVRADVAGCFDGSPCIGGACTFGCRRAVGEDGFPLCACGGETSLAIHLPWSKGGCRDPRPDELKPEPVADYVVTDEVTVESTPSGTRLYIDGQQMKLVPVDQGIDLGLCARIIELEGQVQTAARENNRLRAESRHQHELAQSRGQRVFDLQGELANARDWERGAQSLLPGFQAEVVSLREQRDELNIMLDNREAAIDEIQSERDEANEKLAQVEEALEGPGTYEDAINRVAGVVYG